MQLFPQKSTALSMCLHFASLVNGEWVSFWSSRMSFSHGRMEISLREVEVTGWTFKVKCCLFLVCEIDCSGCIRASRAMSELAAVLTIETKQWLKVINDRHGLNDLKSINTMIIHFVLHEHHIWKHTSARAF